MEYQVPQFIEVENKIVGPLTLRQFIYVAGAAGLCVLFFFYLQIVIAILLSLPVVAFAVALAFYKVNGKPFVEMLEAGFNYYVGDKFFLWKHQDKSNLPKTGSSDPVIATTNVQKSNAKLTRGKLSELAWSLDVSSGGNPVLDSQKK